MAKTNKTINKIDTKSNKLELLISVVPKKKADHYSSLIQSYESNFQVKILAKGAATTELIDYLGLAPTDKIVILSPIKSVNREKILYALENDFHSIKNGKGIAMVTPFTSMVGKLAYGFLSNNEQFAKEESTNGI